MRYAHSTHLNLSLTHPTHTHAHAAFNVPDVLAAKRVSELEDKVAQMAVNSQFGEYNAWMVTMKTLEKNLIYYIPFNEGSGKSAAVLGSKGGGSATFMRGANWDVGSHGAALKLDGKTNYALGPEIKGNPALKDITVCIWAKFASTSSGGARQYMVDTAKHNYILLVDQVSSGTSVKVR